MSFLTAVMAADVPPEFAVDRRISAMLKRTADEPWQETRTSRTQTVFVAEPLMMATSVADAATARPVTAAE